MTEEEEIIEIARHADREWDCDRDMFEWLETFAKLLAEKEREAILDLVDGYAKNNTDLVEAIRARGKE
jgi:hypothetical protein